MALVQAAMIAATQSLCDAQTAAIKQWFAAHIPAYPEIQARAHEELDRVVGRDRLPTPEDEKNLPYIRSIIKAGLLSLACCVYLPSCD